MNAKAHAVATIGVAASGTVIPPRVDNFALLTSMLVDLPREKEYGAHFHYLAALTADLTGTVNIAADVIVCF